jgi:hypothetical protein
MGSENMEEINEEIVAVIEAAIYAAFGNSASKFRIKTIKRVSSDMPEWRKAGLYSQMK